MAVELGSGPWRHSANTVPPLSALTCRIVWRDIIASQQLLPMETIMTVSHAGLCNVWASGTMTQRVCEFRMGHHFCQGLSGFMFQDMCWNAFKFFSLRPEKYFNFGVNYHKQLAKKWFGWTWLYFVWSGCNKALPSDRFMWHYPYVSLSH